MCGYLLTKGVIRWYISHSYAMFQFLTSLVNFHVDCFVLVCRRNTDNVPCFGTIFTRTLECPLSDSTFTLRVAPHYWWRTSCTEKNHNIWDRGEARGRLLLAKIVGCYIPCSINLYGYIGYIYCRNDFFSYVCACLCGNWKYCYFHKIQFPNWRRCQTRRHNLLNWWSNPCETQLGMLPQDGSTRLYWLKWLIKLDITCDHLEVWSVRTSIIVLSRF